MQAFVIDTYKGGLAQREMPDPAPRSTTWSSRSKRRASEIRASEGHSRYAIQPVENR
jgi:hypothetical protein